MENFSEILKDLIDEKGVSLRTIESQCDVPSSQISRYLKQTIPTINTAIKLANYFECSLDYMFGITNEKKFIKGAFYDLTKFIPRYEKALKENNLTHWKFAKNFNISEACLRHWKHGEAPRLDTLAIIAKNLGTSIDELIGRL